MFINCRYNTDVDKVTYFGFDVTHMSNPELNKTFKSDNPPKDYRDASAYAVEHATDYCTSSSSVDHFVMDSDEFGWYTDEFGAEWFDYLDKLPDLEQSAGEKRQAGITALVSYFQSTLGVNDAFAQALAESNYERFGEYLIPRVLEYQQRG
jgi:hypothetical protein